MRRLAEKPDGLYVVGGRCYRVVVLFEECTLWREEVSKKAAWLYRNGVYVGGCRIIYEVYRELCDVVAKMLRG